MREPYSSESSPSATTSVTVETELTVLSGDVLEDCWLTLDQVAAACMVEPDWLLAHIESGLLPQAESVAGVWRCSSTTLIRAWRMRQLERDFDAVPELAALVADMQEELDRLRQHLRRAGLV